MKEDQKRSVAVMIGIAALLQIISQYIRYSECSRLGGGGGTCSVGSYSLQSMNFGYAYTTSGLLIIILLIFAFVFSFQSSNKVFGLITTAFTLKILQIIFALLSFRINGGNLRDAFKFIVGYTLNFYGDFALGTRLNPILLFSSIAIPILLIITMIRAQIPRPNVIESQQIWEQPISLDAAPQMNAPRVAAGWYPNPLANNAVMYWDGSQWLNIPSPTQIGTSTESSGLAIAAFVTAFFVPILPIIFGHISLSQINRSNGRISGKGLAIAGLVLGYVALVGWIFLFIGMVVANNYMYSDY
jgi:hypothetical protein